MSYEPRRPRRRRRERGEGRKLLGKRESPDQSAGKPANETDHKARRLVEKIEGLRR